MATACGLVIIKDFTYRDQPGEEWSNKYWFTGGIPADDNAWQALLDEVLQTEEACYSSSTRVVRAYGYNDTSDAAFAVFIRDYIADGPPPTGQLTPAAGQLPYAGDQAGMCWWRTNRRNQRGKWVYLRKYFHGGYLSDVELDEPSANTKSAYNAHVLKMSNGSMSNGRIIRSQLQDEVITAAEASQWVTTRTLKRRGKRPVPATP